VYFIIDGDVAATKEKRDRYSEELLIGEGKILSVLGRGVSFGELGVLYGTNRTASCVPLQKVTLLCLEGEIFKSILGDHLRELNRVKFDILSKLKIFFGWDRSELTGLLSHIYLRSPDHNSYVYKRGESNSNLYIILEGEVELTVPILQKRIPRTSQQVLSKEILLKKC
jgi:CRP-like cAMP-binding protein